MHLSTTRRQTYSQIDVSGYVVIFSDLDRVQRVLRVQLALVVSEASLVGASFEDFAESALRDGLAVDLLRGHSEGFAGLDRLTIGVQHQLVGVVFISAGKLQNEVPEYQVLFDNVDALNLFDKLLCIGTAARNQ